MTPCVNSVLPYAVISNAVLALKTPAHSSRASIADDGPVAERRVRFIMPPCGALRYPRTRRPGCRAAVLTRPEPKLSFLAARGHAIPPVVQFQPGVN